MNFLELLQQFLMSWYAVLTILGSVFIISTRLGWIDLIKKLKVQYNNKNVKASTQSAEDPQGVAFKEEDLENIKSFLSQRGIKTYQEFESAIKDLGSSIENHTKTITEKENTISQLNNLVNQLLGTSKFYEFLYLNLFLVYNSKLALWWFYNQMPGRSATKEIFMAQFPLPPQIQNPPVEKEAIINALVTNGLLEAIPGNILKASQKGEEFLKFVGLVKN